MQATTHYSRTSVGARLALVAALVLPLLAVPGEARAASLVVAPGLVHVAEDGACSLREAIANAEQDAMVHPDCPAGSGHDVVTLPAGTYDLHNGRAHGLESAFTIGTELTLIGAGAVARHGAEPTVLDAGGTMRHFHLPAGPHNPVQVSGLHLVGMRLTGGAADIGGAILSHGTLTASDVHFVANHATESGGAIATASSESVATTTLIGTRLTGNQAPTGAAIRASSAAITLLDTTVDHNVADAGSAIVVRGGSAVVHGSRVDANTGTGITSLAADTEVVATTVSRNVGALAGGLLNYATEVCGLGWCQPRSSSLVVRDSTISGNTATDGFGAGGIWSETRRDEWELGHRAIVTLTNVTIAANHAPSAQVYADVVHARNTVVVGQGCKPGRNQPPPPGHWPGWTGATNVADGDCPGVAGFTQVSDALLAPLSDNGGDVLTHLPHPASVLVDAGDQAACSEDRRAGAATDQRGSGFPRTVGPRCDIGAIEADPASAVQALRLDVETLELQHRGRGGGEGPRRALLAKLDAASRSIARGDQEATSGQLGSFTNQVEAYAGGPIMERDVERLLAGARATIGFVSR